MDWMKPFAYLVQDPHNENDTKKILIIIVCVYVSPWLDYVLPKGKDLILVIFFTFICPFIP